MGGQGSKSHMDAPHTKGVEQRPPHPHLAQHTVGSSCMKPTAWLSICLLTNMIDVSLQEHLGGLGAREG